MINIKFLENYFRFLFLSFWPIIWYEWIVVTNVLIKSILVALYCVISLIYIILIISSKENNIKSITLYYQISIILSYVFTLFSFLIFPTSLTFLVLSMIFIFICLYFSYIKLFKYKIEEGLVGILSSILLVITILFINA